MLAFCLFAFQIEKILASPINQTIIEVPVQIYDGNGFLDYYYCKTYSGFDCFIIRLFWTNAIPFLLGFVIGIFHWFFVTAHHYICYCFNRRAKLQNEKKRSKRNKNKVSKNENNIIKAIDKSKSKPIEDGEPCDENKIKILHLNL